MSPPLQFVIRDGKVWQVIPIYDQMTGTLSPFLTDAVDHCFASDHVVSQELCEDLTDPTQPDVLNNGQQCVGKILDPDCELS